MEKKLDTTKLTWAALLGQWVEFAKSATALPQTDEGRAMRKVVPDIIALQAVTCALDHLHELPAEEQMVGLDRAGVLIERHAANLQKVYGDEMHEGLKKLIADAKTAWAAC